MPIVHKIGELYKNIYNLKKSSNKADRYGILLRVEEIILFVLEQSIETALTTAKDKAPLLQKVRIKIEVVKRLVRLMLDLKIILPKKYFELEDELQEISKMATGWQRYANNKES